MIESDIQSASPGQLVELFEVDLSTIGIDEQYYFHNDVNDLGNNVVFNGISYTRYPIDAQGFERNGNGNQPRPTLTIANIDGLIGAVSRANEDLVKVKFIRRRTFLQYLDAVNFPGLKVIFASAPASGALITGIDAEAVEYDLGTGNGVTTTFNTPFRVEITEPLQVYKSDWQGNQLQYAVPKSNILQRSEEFTNAYWGKSQTTVVADSALAPDGTTTMDSFIATAVSASHYVDINVTTSITPALEMEGSIFVKQGNSKAVRLQVYGVGNWHHAVSLDFTTGLTSFSSDNGGGQYTRSYGATLIAPGIWRLWIIGYPDTSGTNRRFRINFTNAAGTYNYLGDGVTVGIYTWGAQLGPGSVLTSYKKTTTAPVTITDYSTTEGVNPTADPNAAFDEEIWFIDRKASESKGFIQWELVSALDLEGTMLPRRQCIQNVCTWKYRSAECSYAGGAIADKNDALTTDLALDDCGKRLNSCRLRFGNNTLPYGGFPSINLIK